MLGVELERSPGGRQRLKKIPRIFWTQRANRVGYWTVMESQCCGTHIPMVTRDSKPNEAEPDQINQTN